MSSEARSDGEHGRAIRIRIDEKEYRAPEAIMTGAQLKALGSVPSDYRLFQDIEGGTDKEIGDAESVHLKNGEQFYSLPLGTVGGPLEDLLQRELEVLRSEFPEATLHEEPSNRHVHVPNVPLPPGWNRERSDILLQIPPTYPGSAIPGFEADSDLRRVNGAQPAGSGLQVFDGRQYLHFCWNPKTLGPSGRWVSLGQAMHFALSRFLEAQ